jgi:hypothetical protein
MPGACVIYYYLYHEKENNNKKIKKYSNVYNKNDINNNIIYKTFIRIENFIAETFLDHIFR